MNIERVARTLLGAASLCGLFVSAGCNQALSSGNSGAPPGGTPIASVKAPGDWGASMLAGGRVGIGMVPAKFTFDVNAAPSCANDYVAFNTTLAGVSPSAAAIQTGTWTGAVANSGTVTITSTEATLVLTASSTVNTGLNFQVITSTTVEATNLAAAINRNNFATLGAGHVKVRATSAAGVVTVAASVNGTTNLNGSEGNLITLAQTISPASRFSWAGATLTGGVGTGNIVAFNNLYATQGSATGFCPQDGPSVYWSYFTGTGTAVTSIVLSGDGSKVAYVENVAGTATLRVLKWKAGEGAAAGFPSALDQDISGANWSTCTAGNSCIASIAFSGAAATDIKSSPFYVYANNADVLYVGDNSGRAHKFTGVFNGTPAEVTTGWPITVNAGATLTSPIYDSGSGNIFVGDSTGSLSYIREIGSTVGSACTLPCLGTPSLHIGGAGGSIDDAPIVDGTAGLVIATNSNDGTNFGTILQATTALGSPVSFKIGGTAAGSAIYSGAFDNTYFSTPGSGHMYVCGKATTNTDRPAIYQLSFNSSAVLTGVGTPFGNAPNTLATASGEACSPVTEFYNPNGAGTGVARDWIFFSIGNNATSTNPPLPTAVCSTVGCVISVDVTGGPAWPPTVATHIVPVPANAAGSTSGFAVDNAADITVSPQTSSFYFTLGTNSTGAGPGVPSCNTTAAVGCAVKLTQGLLN